MDKAQAKHKVTYSIEGQPFSYEVAGALAEPSDNCMIRSDDDLTAGKSWADQGYTVQTLWSEAFSQALRESLHRIIAEAFSTATGRALGALEHYHQQLSDEEHMRVVARLKRLPFEAQGKVDLAGIEKAVGGLLGFAVSSYNKTLACHACSVRIVRPHGQDNNPLHRDVWLDHLRHGLNFYFPLAGSNAQSSLTLIPGSHHWRESDMHRLADRSHIGTANYAVPSVISSVHGLHMKRPEVGAGEVMLFSPYCVHGGARNLSDVTRMSLEMRFWRQA